MSGDGDTMQHWSLATLIALIFSGQRKFSKTEKKELDKTPKVKAFDITTLPMDGQMELYLRNSPTVSLEWNNILSDDIAKIISTSFEREFYTGDTKKKKENQRMTFLMLKCLQLIKLDFIWKTRTILTLT